MQLNIRNISVYLPAFASSKLYCVNGDKCYRVQERIKQNGAPTASPTCANANPAPYCYVTQTKHTLHTTSAQI